MRLVVSLIAAAVAYCAAAAEFAASFEVKVDRIVDKAEMGYGFRLRGTAPFAEGQLIFEIPGPAVSFGPKNLVVGFDTAFRTNLWHHLAVAYREDSNEAKVWVDGRLMGVAHTFSTEPVGVAAFQKAPKAAADFPGTIRNARTWQKIPAESELLPADVIRPIVDAAFAKEASLIRDYDGKAPEGGILPVAIDRHAAEKHVPFRTPSDASVLKELRMAAAQGEIEDASFLVLPFRDVKDFHVRVSDLKGQADTVKADAIDIRIVKNWLQCRWGWMSFYAGGIQFPQLTPELLVHDDRLVYVDEKTHKNMLRLSYPAGEHYVSVSDYANIESYPRFNYNLEPVRDADRLLPYDLRRGDYSQLWLTLRCPADAKGGDYTGAITLSAGGKDVLSFPLVLTVHPFKLPRPGCHYDPDRTFMATWMGHYSLKEKLTGAERYTDGGCSLSNALRRQMAEFRSLAEHNCGYPWTTAFGGDAELAELQLDVQQASGCEMKPILGDIGVAWGFALWAVYPPEGKKDLSVEANREYWEKEMREYSNAVAKASALVEKKLGHRDIVYYAYDEAAPNVVRREFPFFATLNHFGGTSFTTGGVDSEAAFMTDIDDASGGFNAEKSRRWHEAGARIMSYASPHGGPECPDIWRREKGLGSYFADLDGVNEYIWYEGHHIWNEFLDGPGREYKNFNMVYPTADGVLETVQWEAVREGLDDIRYFTLLSRVARAAMKAKDAALAAEGRQAVRWMETADWKKGDLDALRREAARRIVALRDALKPTGFDIAAVTDLPACPSGALPALPKPDGFASSEELEASAKAYGQKGCCDVAAAFYRAAAGKASGERRANLLVAAAEAAVRLRDVKTALACLEDGIAMGKDAGEAFRRLRVGKAMLPFRCQGEVRPDKSAVAAAEAVVEKYGTFQDRFDCLKLVLASGDAARAAAGFATVYENTKTLRFEAARAAGEAYRAAGDMKKAAGWYGRAAGLTGMQRYDMLNAAGECALAAGDHVTALDHYTALLKCINKEEQESKYNAAQARVAMLSNIVRKKSGGPSVEPDAGDGEAISLDEDL